MSFKKAIQDFTDEERKEFTDLRLKLLTQFTSIVQKHGGHAFLDCGTLLGAIRNQDFIPWDNDMDVGIKHEELTQDLVNELDENFIVRMAHPFIDDFFFSSYILKENGKPKKYKGVLVWIDLMVYYPYANGLTVVSNDAPEYLTTKLFMLPGFAISNFKTLNFLGHDFYIPEDEIAWLETWYTKDWINPRPKRTRAQNYIKRDKDFTYDINKYKNLKVSKLF